MDKKNKLADEKKRQELKKQEEALYAQLNKKVEDIGTRLFVVKNESIPSLMNETQNELKTIVPLSSKLNDPDQSNSLRQIEGSLNEIFQSWNNARKRGLISTVTEETAATRLTNALKSQLATIKEKAIQSTDLNSKQKLLEALEELSRILPTDTLKEALLDPSSYHQSDLKKFILRYRELHNQLGIPDSTDFANTTETYISKLIEGVSLSKDIARLLAQQSASLQDILPNLDDEDKQLAVLDLSDNLQQLSSSITVASKRAFNGFGNKITREKLDKVIAAVKNEVSNNDLPMGDTKVLMDMLNRLEALSKSATIPVVPVPISKAIDELVNNVKKQLNNAKDVSTKLAISTKPFQEAVDYLKNSCNVIYPKIRDALGGTGSIEEVVDIIRNLEKYQQILEKETGKDANIIKGGKSMINSAVKVKALTKQEMKKNYTPTEIARLLEKRMKKQAALIRNQANITRDSNVKRMIADLADETLATAKNVMDTASILIANPNDENSAESFTKLIIAYQNQGDRLEKLAPTNVTLLNGSRNIVEKMKDLKGLLIDPQDDANNVAKDIIAQISRQVALGRAAAIAYRDLNLRQEILRICDELEGLIPPIVEALRNVFKNPQDATYVRILNNLLDRAKELSTQLNRLIPEANDLNTNGQYLEASLHKLSNMLGDVSELTKARELLNNFASKKALQDLAASIKDPNLLQHLERLTEYLSGLKSAVDADVTTVTFVFAVIILIIQGQSSRGSYSN